MKKHKMGTAFSIIFSLCMLFVLAACSSEPNDAHKYTLDDLYAWGLTDQDVITIIPMKGNLSKIDSTECPATDLQNFLRIVDALTQDNPAPDMEPYALSPVYRKLEFTGATVEGYAAAEIDGKAYVQRSDGVVCKLDNGQYKFMLDFCSVVLPYPEDLNPQEFLPIVKEATANLLPGVRQPEDVNFILPDVQTVQDFYITDFSPYSFSDIEAPEGTYVAIVPCGYYYEVQIGLTKADGQWQSTDLRIARSNIKMMQDCTNKDLRVVVFGPSITDISGWGMAPTDKVELYHYETGEVLWKTDGVCFTGDLVWSEDERYMAFACEVGRAEKRGSQLIVVDTSDMTAKTRLSPDGTVSSRVHSLAWNSNTELQLYYEIIGQASRKMVYDTVTDHVLEASDQTSPQQTGTPETTIDPALIKITPEQAEAIARETAAALCGELSPLRDWDKESLLCNGNYLRPDEQNGVYPIEEMDEMHRYDEGKITWDSPIYSVHFVDGKDGIGTYLTICVDAQTGEIVGGVISGE